MLPNFAMLIPCQMIPSVTFYAQLFAKLSLKGNSLWERVVPVCLQCYDYQE